MGDDAVVFVGVVHFPDRSHQEVVMAKADVDERIGQLFAEEARLLALRRVVHEAAIDNGLERKP